MSKWANPDEWARLLAPEGCPICRSGQPTFVIAGLEVSWVVMGEESPPLPGTCALFLRRHAIELHDLAPHEAAAYMRDVQRLSRVVKEATGAVKMNYEIHGNTIPHLHTHLFPRYAGDPFEGAPIDPRRAPDGARALGDHAAIRRRVIAALACETRPA